MRSKLVLAVGAAVTFAGAAILFAAFVALLADQLSNAWAVAAALSAVLLLVGFAVVGVATSATGVQAISLLRGIGTAVRAVPAKIDAQTTHVRRIAAAADLLDDGAAAGAAGRAADATVLVLALGDGVDADALASFVADAGPDSIVVVTDRADVVAQLAKDVLVEFLPAIPAAFARTDVETVGVVAARLVELASEHRASAIMIWDHAEASRQLPVTALDRGVEVYSGAFARRLQQRLDDHAATLDREHARLADLLRTDGDGALERMRSTIVDRVDRVGAAATKHHERTSRALARSEKAIQRSIDDAYQQGEALTALYRLLLPRVDLPPLRGWAISPDLALHIVRRILDGDTTAALETGSGSSTVMMALAFERVGRGHVTALEHDRAYAEATRALLDRYGVAARATVCDAPLTEQVVDGEPWQFYDLSTCTLPDAADLLLVDGPPAAVGRHSRLPCVPLLLDRLADRATIILDDGRRTDEQEIAARWAEIPGVGTPRHLRVERSAIALDFERAPQSDA